MPLVKKEVSCSVETIEKTVNEKQVKVYRFIGSTETPDRGGDIIETAGWETANWEKNPVVLWGHNHHQPPIGRAVVLRNDEAKHISFDVEFVEEGVHPLADTVRKLVDKGYVKAVSVGFLPMEYEEIPEEQVPKHLQNSWFPPVRFKRQELIELSIVSIPMNPEALAVLNSAEQLQYFNGSVNDHLGRRFDEPDRMQSILIGRQISLTLKKPLEDQANAINQLTNVIKDLSQLVEIIADGQTASGSAREDKSETAFKQLIDDVNSARKDLFKVK